MAIGFLVLGGMGLFGYAALTAGRAGLSFGIASGLMGVIALLIVTVALPRFNQYFIAPPQVLADIAGLNLEESDTLIVYGRPKPSLLFYARRRCPAGKPWIEVIKPGEEEKLRPVLDRPGQIMILTLERLRAKRSEEHTSELQSQSNLVCRLLLEKKKKKRKSIRSCNR